MEIDTSKNMGGGSEDYYKRTCECFARAMEQYYAIKQGTEKELYSSRDQVGAYMDHEKFVAIIMPLCDKFIKDNDQLLKAFFRRFNKYMRIQ